MRLRYYFSLLFAAAILFAIEPSQAQTFFTAELTPDQETQNVESSGAGTAALVLTDEGLRFLVTVDSLTGDIAAAHFHNAAMGVDGGVVRGISDSFEGNTASGIWTASDDQALTDEMIAELFAGNLYLNVHTAEYGAGELRGQVLPTSGAGLSAHLTADQSTGDVTSDGTGSASVQLTDQGALYYVTVDGLTGDIANAHFHSSAIGTDGGVVHGIAADFDGQTAFGVWRPADLTAEHRASLLQGELYLNIHTAAYPAGEIRGQVLPSTGWGFHADLDADQSTGDVTSGGTGTGTFTLTDEGLTFHLTVDGLTGPITNAHFHRAPAGEDGGVVRGIMDEFEGNTSSGIWTSDDDQALSEELVRDLLAGNVYVNIHTDAYPAGEIRGQVLLRDGAELTAHLTSDQEPGDVTSEATGSAALSLTDEGLSYRITVNGLTGPITGAHFHEARIGSNGGVVHGITDAFDGGTASGIWTSSDDQPLTAERIESLLKGELYLNVHTEANSGGEIRGQVLVSEGAGLRAALTNEQASTDQEGSGTATLTLTEQGVIYRVTVTGLSGDVTNAHFHEGAAGVNGGVVHGIFDAFDGNTATGVWTPSDDQPLTDDMVTALVRGELYLNIHTAANPGGEIRGQVVASSGIGSAVQLDPGQEGAGVESMGTGTASLNLTQAGLAYRLTATGMTGTINSGHFHNAPFGENGGVVRGISDDFVDGTAAGIWRASDDQALTTELTRELLAGNLYLNLHTAAYPAGEIRGQVRPGNVVSTAIEPASDELPNLFRLEQNYPNPFNPSTTVEFAMTESTHALLEVYDVVGRQVTTLIDGVMPAGEYQVRFDGADLPSGVYFYRLSAGSRQATRSMLLLK
ncbi:MAG: CHRD domain-containing protein [Rhodothermales bacterium]